MNRSWRRYARFWGARVDADVDDELAFHFEMRVRDYMARGMSEHDARETALNRLGNLGSAREACLTIGHRRQRRVTRTQILDALAQDVRYALRTLAKQKAWTVVALLTMSLGIGASTAVFSAVDGVILNPLSYRNANRVVSIWRDAASGIMVTPSDAMFAAWTMRARSLESIERYGTKPMTLTGRGEAATVNAGLVRPSFAEFAGVHIIAGRMFAPDEMFSNNRRVAVIGEPMWRERFGGSANVIGQTLTLDDKPYTIIGIAPANLRLPALDAPTTDAWLPLVKDSVNPFSFTIARLKRGVSVAAAEKELNAIDDQEHLSGDFGPKFVIRLVHPGDLSTTRTALLLLAGAVALLLLVACANVAHLLLARGATRERELAIRAALGAGRWRLARQLLTESTVLAAAGCLGGVAIAYAGVRALAVARPDSLSELSYAQLDARALWAAIAMSALAGMAFGCAAALHAIRRASHDALRASASGTAAARTQTLRSLLVVSEMAVSAVLLVGAALLVRSVTKLEQIDPHFDARNLYAMTLTLPHDHYSASSDRYNFVQRVMQSAAALPGVTAVTVSSGTPPHLGGVFLAEVRTEDGVAASGAGEVVQPLNFVVASYFQTLGIRLTGSTFGASPIEQHEVIVNRGFASKYWPGQSAVGRRFRFTSANDKQPADWMTVVGVADDVPTNGLAADLSSPFVYRPIDPKHMNTRVVVSVRTKDGVDPVPSLRRLVTSFDSRMAPPPVQTVESDLARSISIQRFTMTLLAAFASLAVVLSAVGLYGVISYIVTQRTREIGIRIALGATPRLVARAIGTRALVLSVAGLAIGLTASVWATRLIQGQLYEIRGTDAAAYLVTGLLLLGISLAACAVPMRRAMRVDPVIAMRGD
ncbi:MAG TPA: ABC transporter permease [Gemmatimonadaceae bacterium]|nr:ABC transporter permease [Gemmatimonadaceae bacterium]